MRVSAMQALDQERRAKHHCSNENPTIAPLKEKRLSNAEVGV